MEYYENIAINFQETLLAFVEEVLLPSASGLSFDLDTEFFKIYKKKKWIIKKLHARPILKN